MHLLLPLTCLMHLKFYDFCELKNTKIHIIPFYDGYYFFQKINLLFTNSYLY